MSVVDVAVKNVAVSALQSVTEDADLVKSFTDALMEALSQKGGRRRVKKDPNAPKKAVSAFFHYCAEHREKVRKDNADADGKLQGVADATRVMSEMWKKLPEKSRAKYTKLAEADKARYEKEMAEYSA